MIDIKLGARPLRPTDPSQNRWLQDRVWNVITTCWDHDPGRRCELSVVCQVFSTPSIVVESVHPERPDGREGPPLGLGSSQDIQNAHLGDRKLS